MMMPFPHLIVTSTVSTIMQKQANWLQRIPNNEKTKLMVQDLMAQDKRCTLKLGFNFSCCRARYSR
jgi:hypothetical protein